MREALEAATFGDLAYGVVGFEEQLLREHDPLGIYVIGDVHSGELLKDAREVGAGN